MSFFTKSIHKIFLKIIVLEIIGMLLLARFEKSGMMAVMMFLLIVGTLVTWPIVATIERRAQREPKVSLDATQMRNFKIIRGVIIAAVLGYIIYMIAASLLT